ncbi:hypothetical protein GUITHDRAFT_133041 [Guillardia theta CCMP2712]|uniref:Uncharacterized protein n=1 Tax=Guillardia theta (strain CCMP2712) TaxID=905079 RepID=L1JYN3_GUITC|nr:hypothetical protein GUITHDRAFT_133041 [Guillardia theta CCMP2712]EKX53300.1 hypothetical protein GUITHDRAFT_133041 [Guillardia theta CCMP2712]|eukprot:XP_005840280.1 hypothetical protein GUITHDRAFT_133041 [Guillardia theta CCMP2712]
MSNPFDRLLQFAEKVEKNAPIVFTKEEEKLIEEIQAQQSVLTKLQEEFQAASIEDGSTWTSFRFETKEASPKLLRSEDEGNQDIIKACREHVVNTAASMVQRTFRGHIGRRMFADVAEEEIRQGASVLIQRMYRGAKQRTMMRNILQEDSDDSESDSEDDGFLNTRHPATGKILKNAPQYGKAINETRRQHHYPRAASEFVVVKFYQFCKMEKNERHDNPADMLKKSQEIESKLLKVDHELDEAMSTIIFTDACFEQLDKTLLTRERALKEILRRRAATRREVHLVQQLKDTPEGQFLEMVPGEEKESSNQDDQGRKKSLLQAHEDGEIDSKVSAFVAALNRKKRK